MTAEEGITQLFEKQVFGCDIDGLALSVTVAVLVARSLSNRAAFSNRPPNC
ncbi:MAG: hypothetical protein K2X93_27845 [Candidatus Obscuribacterales bacterium]|nr:hypothetical protein [Candidatus Obscuribacterales bacterium]